MSIVPTVKLSSGEEIPVIGLGFWMVPKDVATEVAYQGLRTGYRLLDSAQAYQNEREVVEGIVKWIDEDPTNNKRDDVTYTSKVFLSNNGYEKTKASIEESLEKAKELGYIDIMLIHQPYADSDSRTGTWKALEEAVEAGKIKSIGISNYGIEPTKELLESSDLKIKPAINQLELHPGMTRKDLVNYLKENNILAEAYSPLMHAHRLEDAGLVNLGKKYGKTASQVLLRWSIQMGFVPLPKSTHIERIKEDFDIFDFELTEAEVQALADWDDYLPFKWDFTNDFFKLEKDRLSEVVAEF